MSSALFRAQVFPVQGSGKIACIVTGYGGKIARYKSVIRTLNKQGFTVVGYEHASSVFTGGNPRALVHLLDEICADLTKQAADYQQIICIGVSAGAGLCLALQRRMPAIRYGIYAGAGEPGQQALDRPLFYFLRKRFHEHGYSAANVKSLWQELDISPNKPPRQPTPFVMVLGKRDRLVRYDKALAALHAWQRAGVPITIITRPHLGHLGIIRWHKRHIVELLAEAERLTTHP